MKIGFLGNANNYPMMLARAIRSLGHEVLYIIDRSSQCPSGKLDRPEYRYDDISVPYPDWIYDLSPLEFWYGDSFPQENAAKVVSLLQTCDAVILNGYGVFLLDQIQRPAITLLTGTDLEFLSRYQYIQQFHPPKILLRHPRMSIVAFLNWLRFLNKLGTLIYRQRWAIRNATAVSYFAKGLLPRADQLLRQIGAKDDRRIFILMSNIEKINLQPIATNSKYRIFCVARITWKKPVPFKVGSELDYKGSDIMIRGLGLFSRQSGLSLDIRLVSKGKDIQETMALIEAEGLSEQVTWLSEMTQLEIFSEYQQADIVFEQLGQGMIGMGALDAMAMGRPVIANGRPEIIEPLQGEPSPLCQARTPEEVAAQLQRLVSNPAERERIGMASRRYVEKYFAPEQAAKLCLERLFTAISR